MKVIFEGLKKALQKGPTAHWEIQDKEYRYIYTLSHCSIIKTTKKIDE